MLMPTPPPEAFGIPTGWKYYDLPNMLPKYMDELLEAFGEENYKFITFSERKWPDGVETVRGQLFISPEGLEKIKTFKVK